MKKEYIKPVIEKEDIDISDLIMASDPLATDTEDYTGGGEGGPGNGNDDADVGAKGNHGWLNWGDDDF